jgi:hypothetical protein
MYLKLSPNNNSNNNSSKKRTVFWVSSIHIMALVLIFFIFCFKGCTTKKPNAIRVNIIASSSQPVKTTVSSPTKKPLPQTQKKIHKKTIPQKTWKALDPSQIKKSTSTVTRKAPPKKNNSVNPVQASNIANNIRQNIKKIKFNRSRDEAYFLSNYYDKVSQYLYKKWEQPARTATYNGIPVVKIRVSIDSNGKILSSSIVSKSNIASMNSSIARLLSTLSSLPKPPEGAMEFDIYLELENN